MRVGTGIQDRVAVVSGPVAGARHSSHAAETLRANLQDRVVLRLMMILLAAQSADILTTYHALSSSGYVEQNPLFRILLARSPLVGYTVKLVLALWMALLAMSYLRGKRVAAALGLAAVLSLVAPVMNAFLLLHG